MSPRAHLVITRCARASKPDSNTGIHLLTPLHADGILILSSTVSTVCLFELVVVSVGGHECVIFVALK